ncbi:peptidoglycan -binding protein [Amaricoccus sp.]|uniref:peptidoglycan -binding protein n=1 Tax=Amaricoccus sp. TaxID=1872485 RepID=UPI001B5380AD|nr:peptidoglycan -binding protein [Amaricoccus sp.]MBP7001748.1 peptidoglycan -binding protein [Amaricoccus sp.]
MALASRRGNRFQLLIWPGFVDVMTALVLVLFFVLSIFMIVQFVLRDTITGKDRELDELSVQVANLADALGLARSEADTRAALISTLTGERDAQAERLADFEAQVASLIARNTDLSGSLEAAQAESAERLSASQALELSLAQARTEVDAEKEAARLAAARREALEALVASLRGEAATRAGELAAQGTRLDEAEAARLAEAAAAEELRKRLEGSQAELTAMTLSLEAERKRAGETLTLLAAAEAARDRLAGSEAAALTDAERRAGELAQARALLSEQQEVSGEAQRQVAVLNQQTAELRRQLDGLQGLLDSAADRDADAKVQIETLGSNLNAALARVASEEQARAALEARERARLEAEAKDLRRYRSEFFGRMQEILGAREGVQVVGDRFVFPSEVLFAPGSATLGPEGQAQVARVAGVIREIASEIPPDIDWVLRVDGHTDKTPLGSGSPFRDNWELSQARALSVVRYMIAAQGVPAERLAATGFGEYQPVDPGDSPEGLARNRRIELKFTER